MVRGTKWWNLSDRAIDTGGSPDEGDLLLFRWAQRRKYRWQTPGKQRLASARWTDKEEVVSSGGCDLKGTTSRCLLAHLG